MTPMREDILKEAEACNAIRFRVSQWHSLHIYPDETYFSVEQLESFYRAAFAKGFAAGQAEMRKRAAKEVDRVVPDLDHLQPCVDDVLKAVRALPIEGENE